MADFDANICYFRHDNSSNRCFHPIIYQYCASEYSPGVVVSVEAVVVAVSEILNTQ